MSIKVEKITAPVTLGEGPHWDDRQQALFFVSILDKTLHKYVPSTGKYTKTSVVNGGRVHFIIPVEGTYNNFVIATERHILIVEWDGEEGSKVNVVKDLGEVDAEKPDNSINDGKIDPRGRLFTGTLSPYDQQGVFQQCSGGIFRVDPNRDYKIEKIWDGITLANGLAWDLKEKAMYYIDSMTYKIRRYDYDVHTGDICNLKYIFDLPENGIEGLPDGMTIDTDGNLWVAVFTGSCVLKIDPRKGEILQKVSIPASQVTSATFGGPNLDVLFVTTASVNFTGGPKPPGGSTYMVTGLGVKGYPANNFKYKN